MKRNEAIARDQYGVRKSNSRAIEFPNGGNGKIPNRLQKIFVVGGGGRVSLAT